MTAQQSINSCAIMVKFQAETIVYQLYQQTIVYQSHKNIKKIFVFYVYLMLINPGKSGDQAYGNLAWNVFMELVESYRNFATSRIYAQTTFL